MTGNQNQLRPNRYDVRNTCICAEIPANASTVG
nr:MAG TPA: hypothetical protein [Caudoviricetes sp.]